MEHDLVGGVGGDIIRQSGLELEGNGIANVIVGGILPVGLGGVGGVVDIFNLFLHFGDIGLRRSGYIAHNLYDVFGVRIVVAGQGTVLILDQIVTGGQAGDDILAIGDGVGGTGSGGQIGSDRLGKRFGIVLGFQRFRLCGSVTQRGLARFADAGTPDDVGQDLVPGFIGGQVAGEDLIGLVGVACSGVIDGNGIGGGLVREGGDSEAQHHDQCQQEAGKFFDVLHCFVSFLLLNFWVVYVVYIFALRRMWIPPSCACYGYTTRSPLRASVSVLRW